MPSDGDQPRQSAALQLVERFLRPHDRGYFDLFEAVGEHAVSSARLLSRLVTELPDSLHLADQIAEQEAAADTATHQVIRSLSDSFVTPIDREDILRLASALDDITDRIDAIAKNLVLYHVEAPMAQAEELADVLAQTTVLLLEAIRRTRRFEDLSEQAAAIHLLEGRGDQILRGAIAALFEARIDPMAVIRWKDIFEELEDAIDAAERAMYVLESIVVKNI
jgi:predicted phosphate transport protein (TIGR00153 family)